ncbi:hypothetical protein GCM10023075_29170 [Streptosporangium album]
MCPPFPTGSLPPNGPIHASPRPPHGLVPAITAGRPGAESWTGVDGSVGTPAAGRMVAHDIGDIRDIKDVAGDQIGGGVHGPGGGRRRMRRRHHRRCPPARPHLLPGRQRLSHPASGSPWGPAQAG